MALTKVNAILLFFISSCLVSFIPPTLAQKPVLRQRGLQSQHQCDIRQLHATEPTRRLKAEAGLIEVWEPNDEQFRCTAVAAVRYVIEPKGLLLPSYTNAPYLTYITQGRGIQGVIVPGCPETFESPRGSESDDQHQRVFRVREGDVIGSPSGVVQWTYNDGDTPIVSVTLLDLSNPQNQLDLNFRSFYLGGNPQGQRSQEQGPREVTGKNIFNGFDDELLANAFNVDTETIRSVKGNNDERGSIIRVERELEFLSPEWEQEEEERMRMRMRMRRFNGLDQTLCALSFKHNIDQPLDADVFNKQGGRITTLNGHKLPLLNIIYITHGTGRIQVARENGRLVFDGRVQEGQLLVVPQNFVVVKKAEQEGLEWVSFKTNDNAMISPLAGRISAIRGMPEEVVMNSYDLSRDEVRMLKTRTATLILPLALTLLILSPTSLAQQWGIQQGQIPFFPSGQSAQPRRLQRGQQALNDCQINRLSAKEPSIRVQAEAGVTEIWDDNDQQELNCAGVTVVRVEVEPKGLLLPHYHNAPSLSYIVRGRGLLGVSIPGCPETFESAAPQQSESRRSERGSEAERDQHQKVRRFHHGHVIALPAGVTRWVYNDGEETLTYVTLYDTANFQNQLDDNLRSFFLAGNLYGRGGQEQERHHHSRQQHDEPSRRSHHRGSRSSSEEGQNILSGFDQDLLGEAYQVDSETINKIQGRNDERGAIIRVEGDLELLVPEYDQEEQRSRHGGGGGRRYNNGVEETLCSARLSGSIDNPEKADIFNPQGGRLTSLNSQKLPILSFLRLSAEKVNLYQNGIFAPNWKINAHSIVYFTKGSGRVQVASNEGRLVFDDNVQEGQLLVIPQNYVVLKKAEREGLEWVSFLTNDQAMNSPLAGRISAIRGMPEEVVMNSYGLSREDARRLKYGRQEISVFSPSQQSQRREKYAIV
ncbi:13S globulin seed storage protein 3 [Bienertia sinuspersici]